MFLYGIKLIRNYANELRNQLIENYETISYSNSKEKEAIICAIQILPFFIIEEEHSNPIVHRDSFTTTFMDNHIATLKTMGKETPIYDDLAVFLSFIVFYNDTNIYNSSQISENFLLLKNTTLHDLFTCSSLYYKDSIEETFFKNHAVPKRKTNFWGK